MTTRQREVQNSMNALLHHRFNEEMLNERLSQIFGQQIEVSEVDDEEWTGDWYYSFNVEDDEIGGFFDIYFLKMREQAEDVFDGLTFYVTEVACDFEIY